MRDLKTEAIVLKRTNYGEADRILNILTPQKKMAVIAKGARKEKSKLAGGIEMFSLTEVVVHFGKGEFGTLTAARAKEFYKGILTDFEKLELAGEILKRVSRAAETVDNEDFFSLAKQVLKALDGQTDTRLIQAWAYLNLAKAHGEQINLYYDTEGEKLAEGENYTWDTMEKALRPAQGGKIGASEIKLARLMLSASLELVARVKGAKEMAGEILTIAG